MNLRKFAKDHKKELIIGGIIVAGVTVIAVSSKTKKPAPVPDFAKIAASTVSQWEEHGCKRMFVSAGLLKDMDKYAQYLQKCFPEALDNGVEMIIGFAPDNKIMHVKSASAELINLI